MSVGTETTGAETVSPPFTVVVGVSPTSRSPVALAWAQEEARIRGGRVVAVRAWRPVPPTYTGNRPPMLGEEPTSALAQEEARLAEDVDGVLGPAHQVECRLVEGGRRRVLLREAAGADLLVLDAPRRSQLSGGVFFAHRLVYSAPCPVVIMAHPQRPPHLSGDDL
jgi:nucleotide-binding universal stress UspA family protein